MKLENIFPAEDLGALARVKRSRYEFTSVPAKDASSLMDESWELVRIGKTRSRLRRAKSIDVDLEDRVWSLCYSLGFSTLSGHGGAKLIIAPNGTFNQLDILAADDDVAIAFECKTSRQRQRRSDFQGELSKFTNARQPLQKAARAFYGPDAKRRVGMVIFYQNAILTDTERDRAQSQDVTLLDEADLDYYEELVEHLGEAARYQFLADIFPKKDIPNLEIRVPAIKTKMGGRPCYSFLISPEYLLKISYVSHRSKGKASDVNTYQRMVKKSRLRDIRRYIDSGEGVFPTNIVINLDMRVSFDRGPQTESSTSDSMGWITLRPRYKSAWIIDGQHRLFAYSGSTRAASSRLSVLAFENLEPSIQAQLFIDINAKQKSVSQSLLQELYAELHWDATDPKVRLRAIIAKSVQTMNEDPESPFYHRIKSAEERESPTRCITLGSLFGALYHDELFATTTRGGSIPSYGPLYAGSDNNATRERITNVINTWFKEIQRSVPDWWNEGKARPFGGIAMNDGVVSQIMVLKSVLEHLEIGGGRLVDLSDCELCDAIRPYAVAVGTYLQSLDSEARRRYRELRGVQGQTTRARRSQKAITLSFPEYFPAGLAEFLEQEDAQTNDQAKSLVDKIEILLQKTILEELKRELGEAESDWWMTGIPQSIRAKAGQRYEEDSGARGGKEFYLDLVDYRDIIRNNWVIFSGIFGYGSPNASKDKRTQWIMDVNDVRKIVAHASSGRRVAFEELALLETYWDWLTASITGKEILEEES
ncbi:MAG: DGQHR domain-containing protein [Thermomicrobiales bacterium]